MHNNKKKRSDKKKIKRRENRKLKGKCLRKYRESKFFLDQQLVEESNTFYLIQAKEIANLKQELKLLKDVFEKKSNENCIKIKKKYFKADLAKLEFESKAALDSGNKILKVNNDDVEKQSPLVLKEEYVEYAENDTVKSEPMDQSKVKNEHLAAFEKSESKPSIQE